MWRGDPRFGPGRDAPAFLPVEVTPPELPAASEPTAGGGAGQIEITLSSGHHLKLVGTVDVDVVLRLARGLAAS